MTGVLKSIHRIAVIFLVASFGFMVAAVIASNTGFQPWRDGLATTALWNGVLAAALYALLAVLLVGESVVRLIVSRRRTQP